ncbi:MAG: hypothetical protein ACXWQ5_00820 [Ktedonobacterales bacterium]
MKHVAGGYHDAIRHVRHETRPRLHAPLGAPIDNPVYHETEPAENVYGQPLLVKDGHVLLERHVYYAHEYAVPTWVVERIEVDDEEPAVHEYGYYVVHTAHFWSRILRPDVLNQMDRYKKTQMVNEIEAAVGNVTETRQHGNPLLDYTQDGTGYPLVPTVRQHEEA